MIASDFKIAIRNIKRNKTHTAISIFGLGIGLGCIILLQALIIHETSYDKFIPDYQNVYRIILGATSSVQYPLAEEMKKDFPEVKNFFRFCQTNEILLKNTKNESVIAHNFAFSDTSIFKILGIKFISGIPANAIDKVAISDKTAKKYFGNISPLGAVLKVKLNNDFINLSVSGIYRDFPSNSTLFPEFIANIKLSEKLFETRLSSLGEYASGIQTILGWNNFGFYSYIVLDKNADKKTLVSKMQKYREMITYESAKKLAYDLQPVRETYLKSAEYYPGYSSFRVGNANQLKYFWSISFLILIISVTNYIFLTRAATADRRRELGTRKVQGASSGNLCRQIILESGLITVLSLIPASFLIDPGMSFINNTLNRTLSNEVFSIPAMWLSLISVVILTGTVSGLSIGYSIARIPSLLLLSGKTSEKSKSKKWDYSFLVLHFSFYIILVISIITVSKQIRYSLTNFTGINPRNILFCGLDSPGLKSGFPSICNEMEKIPGVEKVAGSSWIPFLTTYFPLNLANQMGESVKFDGLIMGEGMTEMLNIEVIEGSSFGTFHPSPIEVLFNESSAKKYNIKAGDNYLEAFHVRGIVRDFHSHSLHSSIQPMAILQENPAKMGLIAIKTDGTNDEAIIKRLRQLYGQFAPDEVFEARYITDHINDLYANDKNQAKIIGAFSILATILAIMGLFGIALISIARKTKEIGLRKVNGASTYEVLFLLNKDIISWVFLSFIIGFPVAFYLMSQWLKRFAYKTDLNWWIFTVAGISAILIAMLTVSWQSWRAATRNPIEALRYE